MLANNLSLFTYTVNFFCQTTNYKSVTPIFLTAVAFLRTHTQELSRLLSKVTKYAPKSASPYQIFIIMNLVKSLLLGSEGSYKIFGVDVKFKSYNPSIIIKARDILMLTPLNIFVHELGHALALKCFGLKPKIKIKLCSDQSSYATWDNSQDVVSLSKSAKAFIYAAGPLLRGAFSNIIIGLSASTLASLAFQPQRVGVTKPFIALSLFLNGLCHLGFETSYAISSIKEHYVEGSSRGDFGQIAALGPQYLILSSALLITEIVLPSFIAPWLFNRSE